MTTPDKVNSLNSEFHFINEFRNAQRAKVISQKLLQEATQPEYHFMEFCGGHTHAIFRHGVHEFLPKNIKMIHGPGCPICVLPMDRIDYAVHLAQKENHILCAYGDLMRVPGNQGLSLLKARGLGASVKLVYSPLDALEMARNNRKKKVVFFAIGFETTAPATANSILTAKKEELNNYFVACNHVLTPSAIQHILESEEVRKHQSLKIDGFLGPAHVSTVIGTKPYVYFAQEYQKPVVISGLEPLDVLMSILMLVRQVNHRESKVENQFTRAVTSEGNKKAQAVIQEVFTLRKHFDWRGPGRIPYSAYKISSNYSEFDIETQSDDFTPAESKNHKACQCPSILRGVKRPLDCKLFAKACTPENPIGSCMVSSEGACAAYYTYGKWD